MLRAYVEQLLDLDTAALQKIAYRNESQSRLLTAKQKQYLFRQAQECGKDMAARLRQKYGACTIEKLVECSGGSIHEIYDPPDSAYALFAFFEMPDRITINSANIEKTGQLMEEYRLESLLGKPCIRDLLLSHELFHLLESRMGKGSFVRQRHVCAFSLGRLKWMRRVGCLEEIAAMSFASELLQLKYSPYIFNIIMLYAFHPQQAGKVMKEYTGNEG